MILLKSREESLCPVNQCTFNISSLYFTTSILAGHLNFTVSKAASAIVVLKLIVLQLEIMERTDSFLAEMSCKQWSKESMAAAVQNVREGMLVQEACSQALQSPF